MVDILLFSTMSIFIAIVIILIIVRMVKALYKTFLEERQYVLCYYHRKKHNGDWKKTEKLFKTVKDRSTFKKKIKNKSNYKLCN